MTMMMIMMMMMIKIIIGDEHQYLEDEEHLDK
jgi:hypothetical protein